MAPNSLLLLAAIGLTVVVLCVRKCLGLASQGGSRHRRRQSPDLADKKPRVGDDDTNGRARPEAPPPHDEQEHPRLTPRQRCEGYTLEALFDRAREDLDRMKPKEAETRFPWSKRASPGVSPHFAGDVLEDLDRDDRTTAAESHRYGQTEPTLPGISTSPAYSITGIDTRRRETRSGLV